jgi:hypothetical protein
LGVIDSGLISAIVVMVVTTTVIAPLPLERALRGGVTDSAVGETGRGKNPLPEAL